MKLDKQNPPSVVTYDGKIYRLMGKKKYYLSTCTTNAGRKRPKGLHVAIWEAANNQAVPDGHHIHHKDGDTFNNDPSNLEAIPAAIHFRHPKRLDMSKQLKHLDSIRHLAKNWHRSEEGRAWHRAHANQSIHKPGVKRYTKVVGERDCRWCGQKFKYKGHRAMFCSKACQAACSRVRLGRSTKLHEHYRATQKQG